MPAVRGMTSRGLYRRAAFAAVVVGLPSAWGDAAAQGYDFPLIKPYAATLVSTEISGLRAIDQRSQIGLRYHQSGPPFEYDLVGLLYTRKRQLEINR